MRSTVKGKITKRITLNTALKAVKREFPTLSRDLRSVAARCRVLLNKNTILRERCGEWGFPRFPLSSHRSH
jgi:hypothetical protein